MKRGDLKSNSDSAGAEHRALRGEQALASASEVVGSRADTDRDREQRLDNAYSDYCRRLADDGSVDAEQFCAEYPELASSLLRQIAVHHAIDDKMSLVLGCCEPLWPHMGDRLLGFELQEELGRGAFARVFRALDTSLGAREIALKVCHRGAREAWILGKLDHENIVPVYSVQHDPELGLSAICMPYLGRLTLHKIMLRAWSGENRPTRASDLLGDPAETADSEQLPKAPAGRLRGSYEEGVVYVAAKIAAALAYAHARGVVHLDVKPSNILMDAGEPRLLDFNLAADRHDERPRLGGTLPYMAPEQASCFLKRQGDQRLDGRADIYSLGVILYEMLTGQLPFGQVAPTVSSQAAVEDLLQRQQRDPATIWQQQTVDPQLRRIVQRCLAVDPRDRYQNATDLVADLRQQLRADRKCVRWARRHGQLLAGAGAAILLMAAALVDGLSARDPYPVRCYRTGLAHLEAQDYDAAIEQLTYALESQTEPAERFDTLLLRAQAYVGSEDYPLAIQDLVAARELGEDGRRLALLGYCYNQTKMHMEAASYYQDAINLGYSTAGVLNNLGYVFLLQGDLDEAEALLDQAAEMTDSTVPLYNRLDLHSRVLEDESRLPTEAIQDVESLVARGADFGLFYMVAARVYAYAASIERSYAAQAREYVDLAISHEIPRASLADDPYVARLFPKLNNAGDASEYQGFGAKRAAAHFMYPLPADTSRSE